MATSRTGTTKYLKNKNKLLHQAQQQGITRCPRCNTWLDYQNRRRPNGATADHILPAKHGGTDHITNLQLLCLRCNIQLKDKNIKQQAKTPTVTTIDFEAGG